MGIEPGEAAAYPWQAYQYRILQQVNPTPPMNWPFSPGRSKHFHSRSRAEWFLNGRII
jgi:hypothetical protein